MFSLALDDEQSQIRDMVDDFVRSEVCPARRQPSCQDQFEFVIPDAIMASASGLGLRYLSLSEARGGPGLPQLTFSVVAETLAFGDAGLAATFCSTAALATALFDKLLQAGGFEDIANDFVGDDLFHLSLVDGRKAKPVVISKYLSDDALDYSVTASREGGAWRLSGMVQSAINAPIAKLFIVIAQDQESGKPQVFLIPAATAGLEIVERRKEEATSDDFFSSTISWRHGAHGEVRFADCVIEDSAWAKDGDIGAFFGYLGKASTLNRAAIATGIARAAFEEAASYTNVRVQGGKPIIRHEPVGLKLASMAAKAEAARLLLWQAAWAQDMQDMSMGDLVRSNAGDIAAAFALRASDEVTLDAAELFGAMGVMRDMPTARLVRDALICAHSADGMDGPLRRIAEALVEPAA